MTGHPQDAIASDDEKKGGRPGPKDQGHQGGMATREVAPEIAEESDSPA